MKGKIKESTVGEPIAVRITRYNLLKIRLSQVQIPLLMLCSPFVRWFHAPWLAVPAVALMIATIYTLYTSKTRERVLVRTFSNRVKVGSTTVRPGEFGLWRWHGHHATIFLPGGNVIVKPVARGQAELLRGQLQSALGTPLRYIRRGSPRVRIGAAAVFVVGVVVLAIGINFNLVYLTPAIVLVLGGFAVFMTFSGKICDPNDPTLLSARSWGGHGRTGSDS